MPNAFTVTIALLIGLLTGLKANALQVDYLVEDSNDPWKLERAFGDPKDIKPLYWKIKLYRHGDAKEGNAHWGIIMEPTYEKCMSRLQSAQRNEDEWLRSSQISLKPGSWTYKNFVGPIAVIKAQKTFNSPFLRNLDRMTDAMHLSDANQFNELTQATESVYQKLRSGLETVRKLISRDSSYSDPSSSKGRLLSSFTAKLVAVHQMMESVTSAFYDSARVIDSETGKPREGVLFHDSNNLQGVLRSLATLEQDLTTATSQIETATGSSRSSSSSSGGSSSSSSGGERTTLRMVDRNFETIQTITVSGNKVIQEVTTLYVNPINNKMYRYVLGDLRNYVLAMRYPVMTDARGQSFYMIEVQCTALGDACGGATISRDVDSPKWQPFNGHDLTYRHAIYFPSEAERDAFIRRLAK